MSDRIGPRPFAVRKAKRKKMAVAGQAVRLVIATLLDKSGGRTKAEGGGRRRLFFAGLDERDVGDYKT